MKGSLVPKYVGASSGVNIVVLSADVVNSANNTLADLIPSGGQGLTFNVYAGKTYWFKAVITYSAAATTTGSRWTVNGPTATINYTSRYTITATTETFNYANAYQLPAAANTDSLTSGNTAIIEGVVTPSADGVFTVQSASEINASAITAKAGSFLFWKQVFPIAA